jgi:hypothetical protein
VANALFLVFLGGLRAFLAGAEGQEPRSAPPVVAAGAVTSGVLVGLLAVGSIAGVDIGAADQVVFLLVAAWVAVLAFGVGWPLPSAAGGRMRPWSKRLGPVQVR